MKVEDNTVTFRFCFRSKTSKTESLLTLRTFLHDKKWLPEDSDYDSNLLEYHSENDGTCEVILKKVVDTSMEELADLFFADILKNKDIFHVTVLYNEHTDKLIQIYSKKYHNSQKVDISDLQKLDEVIILHRK